MGPADHSDRGLRVFERARAAGRGALVWVWVFSAAVNILMLTGPLFMLQVYDRVLGSGSEETLTALFLLVLVLYGFMWVLDYARGRVLARVGARLQSALDVPIFRAELAAACGPQRKANNAAGLRDIEAIQGLLASPGFLALFDLPWVPLFFTAIFVFHPLLGWLGLAGGVTLVLLTALNQILTRKQVLGAQALSSAAHRQALCGMDMADLAAAQGMTDAITARWSSLRHKAQRLTMRSSDISGLLTSLARAVRLLLQSAMLGLGAWLVLQDALTAGAIIAASVLLGRALAPIELSLGQWAGLQRAMNGWRGLRSVLEVGADPEPRLNLPRPRPELRVEGLALMVPQRDGPLRPPILSGIHFDLAPGSALGVIGKSGAGKSALAQALVGLWNPAAGQVRLGGAPIEQYSSEALARFVGYMPQRVDFFPGTVGENIARMAVDFDDASVVKAATTAGAHQMILDLPDGYDTMLGPAGDTLSGGQRQRIALARAVYDAPQLLVLDEPNSALDAEGAEALNRAIRVLTEAGKAVIIMTHRPAAIAECDRLVLLEQGRMRAEGPRDTVLARFVDNAGAVQSGIDPAQRQHNVG